jgi:D-arabinose 1-dehydrogenase-like Zn-dependent alcohol dehydrogenase
MLARKQRRGSGLTGVQFAAKMGLDVIAFSGAEEKKADAKAFGASASYTTSELGDLKLDPPLDLLIATTSQQPEWGPYIGLLAPRATIFPLTISQDNFTIPQMPLLMAGITVQGSVVSPRNSQQRMLAFAARHGIKPQVQKFDMNKAGIEEAFGVLGSNKMRYRGVLVVPSDQRLAV